MQSAIYLRQSKDVAGDELAVGRQLEQCERLCSARGYTVGEVITDNDVSATVGERPGYIRLLGLIEARQIEVVVIYRLDRLLRKLVELEDLIALVERTGVQVASVQGDIDLTTSSGRLVGRLLASVARAEVETKSERQKLANEQRARAGLPHSGHRPYGYQPGRMKLNEAEAAVIREMATRFMAGHSYNEIAWWANDSGHLTATGKMWVGISVRNLLINKRYVGLRDYNGTEYAGLWQPVFNRDTWQRLQLTIKLRADARQKPSIGRKYLLTGLVYCGRCGNRMSGQVRRDPGTTINRRTYSCCIRGEYRRIQGCGVRRNADALEHYVTEAFFDHADISHMVVHDEDDQALSYLLTDREAQAARLDALVDDYATGILSKKQFARAKATATAELARLDQELDRLNRERGHRSILKAGQSVREAWEASESQAWRRSLLPLFIKRITVMPGKTKPWYTLADGRRCKFDPRLIQIEWL